MSDSKSNSGRSKSSATAIELTTRSRSPDLNYYVNHVYSIKRRTCTTFIAGKDASRTSGRSELRCGCKRTREQHSWDSVVGESISWDKRKHTTAACNNAYGKISHNKARYIRCDMETDPNTLTRFMFDVWKVKEPKLIMCIIGGAKHFKMNERLEREFINGIIQTVLKADGWIVTTGFKAGVVQLVGEAIHKFKIVNPSSSITAIACSKWGATRNRDFLLVKNNSKTNEPNRLRDTGPRQKGEQDLEPNHTHFILLDDGTYYGYEIGDYRMRLVKEISSFKRLQIPIVTVVVEGGTDTITTIYKDLLNDIPVVLIDGSGRAASLLAKYLNRTEVSVYRTENDESGDIWKTAVGIDEPRDQAKLEKKFKLYLTEIEQDLKNLLDEKKGKKEIDNIGKQIFYQILYCLQPATRSKIRIFSLDSDLKLDDTIFEAIIQTRQMNNEWKKVSAIRTKLLELALAWDAFEVGKQHIIQNDLSVFEVADQRILFEKALQMDRPNFVNLFLKLDFDVAKFLYKQEVYQWTRDSVVFFKLYNEYCKPERKRHDFLGKYTAKQETVDYVVLNKTLEKLIGDYMKKLYDFKLDSGEESNSLCCPHSRPKRISGALINTHKFDRTVELKPLIDETDPDVIQELAYRDLFLWSVMTNRVEMAKVFLSHMKTRICSALVASKIFKSFSADVQDNESKDLLNSYADDFETYACDCLKECYDRDEDKACEIAIRRIPLYGAVTCLQVAIDADDKKFVGQPCCDKLLTNIWYGKMIISSGGLKKYLVVALNILTFGLLSPFFFEFRSAIENEKAKKKMEGRNKQENSLTSVNESNSVAEIDFTTPLNRLNQRGIDYYGDEYSNEGYLEKSFGSYYRKLVHFHGAPYVKFCYNTISYIFFLLIFSYFMLFEFNYRHDGGISIHWTEILVIVTVTTMLIEDVRQFFFQENRTLIGKFRRYFVQDVFFSSIRVTSYLLFYVGLILRYVGIDNNDCFLASKIMLAYDLEIWFVRSLSFLSIGQKMGPKLVMIRRMVVDLFFFTYIIVIAMTAYGVVSRAMYNYRVTEESEELTFEGRSIFRNIIYPSYYLMYGEVGDEFAALDSRKDDGASIATHVLLAFHMLFVNILLINLLIAMFSHTFEAVQNQTDLVWRYEKYSLIREYFGRPIFFPPLIFLNHLAKIFFSLQKCCCPRKNQSNSTKTFKMIPSVPQIDKDWTEFECYTTNNYVRAALNIRQDTKTRQDTINPETQSTVLAPTSSSADLQAVTDELVSMRRVITELHVHTEQMRQSMQWMMDAMERVKMSRAPRPQFTFPPPVSDRLSED